MRPGGETQTTLDALITPLVREAQVLARQAGTEEDDIAYAPPDEPPPRQPGPTDPPPTDDPPQPPEGDEPEEESPPDEEDEEDRRRRCAALREELAKKRADLKQARKDLELVQMQPFTEVPRDKIQNQLDLLADYGQLEPDTETGPPVDADPEEAEDKDPAADRKAKALQRTWRNMSGYLKMAYTLTFGRYQQIMAARDRAIVELEAIREALMLEIEQLESVRRRDCPDSK
jgi:hypothetical protein